MGQLSHERKGTFCSSILQRTWQRSQGPRGISRTRKKGRGKAKAKADARNQEQSPLPNLLEAHRLRERKTERHAGITFWDPAREASNAITGTHQYAETGGMARALKTESAHSFTVENLSRHARRQAQPLLRQTLSLKRNRKQKSKQELTWPS